MKISKKVSAALLLSSIVLSSAVPAVTPFGSMLVYANEQTTKEGQLSNVSTALDAEFKDTDTVVVIVKLKEESVDPETLKTEDGRTDREEETRKPREKALKLLSKEGINYKKLVEYELLFNGFALETSYAEAKKIQALSVVESVELSVTYNAPETETTNTNKGLAIESNNMIDVQPLWDKGIKGQGQVVAIIDSGVDPGHDILRLTDTSTAKYQSKEQMEEAKKNVGIDYGKWYSDKLIYAYNYIDGNDDLKESETSSHGMHVTGTAVGNPSQTAPTGDYVAGVAPEAQLMFMRVFSDNKAGGSTSSFIYMKAVEDAVKLGADVINMSLGSTAGAASEVGDIVTKALKLAKDAGVTVTIAAGNSGVFGNGYASPLASNPDYGLVGDPSVALDSLAIAAVNNTVINVEAVTVDQLADSADFNKGLGAIQTYKTLFDANKEYNYVYVNLGKESDYERIDMAGKIALVQRGEITFIDKVKYAKAAGAAGILIFNHERGGEDRIGMNLGGEDEDYPVASMGHSFGEELAKHDDTYTLKFTGRNTKISSELANTLTDFTSWGLTADGEIKPDVTAPGGNIYSSFNENTYGTISGTSMASPHAAGAAALVKQVLKERFSSLTGEEMQALIKNLMMSTAVPNINTETKAYTSPRQQGAGILDTTKAALGEVYLTGSDHYGSISLGNVTDKVNFDIVVHNISDTDKELTYTTYVNTDEVEDGSITLRPRQLQVIEGQETVHVPAKSQTTVTITLDTSAFTEELQEQMPNGYYLEGFTFFTDTTTHEQVASIPYVGFKGTFQDLPVFEKPVYDFTGDSKPFYYYLDPSAEELEKDPEDHFTGLFSSIVTDATSEDGTTTLALGEIPNGDGTYLYDASKIAFSPNEDGKQDDVVFKGVALRNYENLSVSIYAKDDVSRQTALYQHGNADGTKTFYDSGQGDKSEFIDATVWEGKDNDDTALPDGSYQYVVRYQPQATGSQIQELSFDVTLDTVAPKMKKATSSYDAQTRTFTPAEVVETGSGLAKAELIYSKEVTEDGKTQTTEEIIEPNKDGSYTLSSDVKLENVRYVLTDYAGNSSETLLAELASENPGRLELQLQQGNRLITDYSSKVVFKVTNLATNQVVNKEYTKDDRILQDLPYGTYKIEVALAADDLQFTGETVKEVTLDENAPHAILVFQAEKIRHNRMTVLFDKATPVGTRIFAVSSDGQETELLQSRYNPLSFEKHLNNGEYTIRVDLPDGYSLATTDLSYTVSNKLNRMDVVLNTPVEVSDLATVLSEDVTATVHFNTAKVYDTSRLLITEISDQEGLADLTSTLTLEENQKQVAYQVAMIRNGQILDVEGTRTISLPLEANVAKVYQRQLDGSLTEVSASLEENRLEIQADSFGSFVILYTPPVTVDKTALETALSQVATFTASEAYTHATEEAKDLYQAALAEATLLFETSDVSQLAIDQTVEKLALSENAILENQVKPSEEPSASEPTIVPSTGKQPEPSPVTTEPSSSEATTSSSTQNQSEPSTDQSANANTSPSSSFSPIVSPLQGGQPETGASQVANDALSPSSSLSPILSPSQGTQSDASTIPDASAVTEGTTSTQATKKVVTPSTSAKKTSLPSTGDTTSTHLVLIGICLMTSFIVGIHLRKEKEKIQP